MSAFDPELLFLTHAIWFLSAVVAAVASVAGAWRSYRNGRVIKQVDRNLNGAMAKLLEEAEKLGYAKGLKEGEDRWCGKT